MYRRLILLLYIRVQDKKMLRSSSRTKRLKCVYLTCCGSELILASTSASTSALR
jgi:hypothetical protein